MPLLWLKPAAMTLRNCLSNQSIEYNELHLIAYLIIELFQPEGNVVINEFPNS